jgi:hypothetical protein
MEDIETVHGNCNGQAPQKAANVNKLIDLRLQREK